MELRQLFSVGAADESITLAPHCLDNVRLRRVGPQLIAQAGNVHVDGAGFHLLRLDMPDACEQLVPGDSAIGVGSQVQQKIDFALGQVGGGAVVESYLTPLEIGQLIRSFSRSVEGIAAIDMLDDAGLISYLEDGGVHVNPRRSTAFYHYLRNLHYLRVRARESGGGHWYTHSETSWR